MKAPRFANTVAQLCAALGISRRWFYSLRRLPGAPKPAADGKFPIAAWRKFIKDKPVKSSEKADLELRCLKLKAERLEHEINDARGITRQRLLEELQGHFDNAALIVRSGLNRMKYELSPTFSSMDDARGIYRLWTEREMQLFDHVCATIRKKAGSRTKELDTRPVENIVRMKANGAPKLNGQATLRQATGKGSRTGVLERYALNYSRGWRNKVELMNKEQVEQLIADALAKVRPIIAGCIHRALSEHGIVPESDLMPGDRPITQRQLMHFIGGGRTQPNGS